MSIDIEEILRHPITLVQQNISTVSQNQLVYIVIEQLLQHLRTLVQRNVTNVLKPLGRLRLPISLVQPIIFTIFRQVGLSIDIE